MAVIVGFVAMTPLILLPILGPILAGFLTGIIAVAEFGVARGFVSGIFLISAFPLITFTSAIGTLFMDYLDLYRAVLDLVGGQWAEP